MGWRLCWERGQAGVTSLVSGDKDKEATPSSCGMWGQRKRGMQDLPEGLGLLVLQRHQHPPWGPGNAEKRECWRDRGHRAAWGHRSPQLAPTGMGTGGPAQEATLGRPPWSPIPTFSIFLFPPIFLSLPKTPSLLPAPQGRPHLDPAGILMGSS